MKLVVISDSHGRADRVGRVMDMHRDYDALLFLGDGLYDVCDVAGAVCVRGNCDYMVREGTDNERMLCFDGARILMMHGHTHSVKSGDGRAIHYAISKGADLLLYGHTHVRKERYVPQGTVIDGQATARPIYVFNPGSLGSFEASYGLVQIKNGSILLSHGKAW